MQVQKSLMETDGWILDGDLGLYDALEVRLRAADTVIFLDFLLVRCVWRAVRRSHERLDFWLWLLRYRWHSRPRIFEAIREHASQARIYRLKNPQSVSRFLAQIEKSQTGEH